MRKFLAHKIAKWVSSRRLEEYCKNWNSNVEKDFNELYVALKKVKYIS